MRTLLAILATTLSLASSAQQPSKVWVPDNGDGTFTNPVLNADYSDPDVIAVGNDYWLTASSFNCMPGLPILHSKDLVNWQIVNYALHHQFPDSIRPQHGNGVWAPSIRHHNGTYYIYWGDPDRGVMMVKTQNPMGKWDEPVCVIPGKGMIDTCPLWDEDGRCYLVNGWANSRAGFNSVLTMRELSADGTKAISDPVIVFDGGNTHFTTEGPKLYKRNGMYWIMCPAGGVPTGWQLAMRSKNIYGPYETKIVLSQGKTTVNGPHQGGWVHTAQGEDWFMHFQDRGPYGRVVWLQPVDWTSGWPIMGKKGEPITTMKKPKTATNVTITTPAENDEFNGGKLGLQWQWQADYDQYFGMPTAYGTMRLFTYRTTILADKPNTQPTNLWNVPNMLLQKLPAQKFTVTTKFRLSSKNNHQQAGIIMFGRDYAALMLERNGENFVVKYVVCNKADVGKPEQITELARLKPTSIDPTDYHRAYHCDIFMRMIVDNGTARFAYSTDGKNYKMTNASFSIREGKWIGAKMGLVATDANTKGDLGIMDIDWFRVTP